jgi:hypothetical protein
MPLQPKEERVPLIDKGHLDEPQEGWTIHLFPPSDDTSETPSSELEPLLPLEGEGQAEADAQDS